MTDSLPLRREASTAARPDDVVLECVFNYLNDPQDRKALSQVSPQWHRIDSITRKHVEIPFCYSVSPLALTRRFKFLDSLKIKGKPRASEFDLLPKDWGAYAEPWVDEIVRAYPAMSKLHFKRMKVTDEDLAQLANKLGNSLEVLKLDKCDGFSTLGLQEIARSCRHMKAIYLEDSTITDNGGEWLHELAQRNSQLEMLNFAMTTLEITDVGDLEMLVKNCKSLLCLKVGEIDSISIKKVLSKATVLQEFAMSNSGDYFTNQYNSPEGIAIDFELPRTLNSLSGDILLPLSPIVASNIRKLDLKLTFLSTEDQLEVLRCCINLEALELLNNIGDEGLAVLANSCKKLRRLRMERAGPDDPGTVSPNSLISLAQNCVHLKFLALHVANVSNAALSAIGQCCQHLVDFRLVLIDSNEIVTELPLDKGMLAVMKGCKKLTRICLYLHHGGLTDTGLADIGKYGGELKWALLGCIGDSDSGLLKFAAGCQKLEKLEMRDCPFTEAAICEAVVRMKSLKYIWVEGRISAQRCSGFRAMSRPFWNMEYCRGSHSQEYFKQLLAYFSLAGVRNDRPDEVISLCPV